MVYTEHDEKFYALDSQVMYIYKSDGLCYFNRKFSFGRDFTNECLCDS